MHKWAFVFLPAICMVILLILLTAFQPSLQVNSVPVPSGEASIRTQVKLPIIMYHSIIIEPSRWGTYVISQQELENDLKYLKSSGYTAIDVQDLLDFVNNGKPLPEKPVMLTFDDGYYNNFVYAFPLLQKYDMKAVLSIIGKYTDQYTVSPDENPLYSHVTWSEAVEMVDSGFIELQNHSYDLHTITGMRKASMKTNDESLNQYETRLLSDSIKLQSRIDQYTHRLPTTYTYPFGLVSKESVKILKDAGFNASLSCSSGMNIITGDPECLYLLKRNLRPHGKSVETILKNLK